MAKIGKKLGNCSRFRQKILKFGTATTVIVMKKEIHYVTADEAVKVVKSGDHVHLSSVASAPRLLIEALCRRGEAGELENVRIHHLHTEGPAPYADPKFEGIFFHQGFFIGANVRQSVQEGWSDYIPVFLGETQKLYRCGALPCDVAMIQVCPPDKHGYVSLGTSVDATLAAIECARTVIAVVNRNVPRAWGQAMIPMDMIDIFVEDDTPLVPGHFSQPDEIETAIGRHCAELIEDGSCLQMGIGAIPNAVLAQLGGHKHLGIHTEMFADGVLGLVDKGVIDGSMKVTDKGKIVATFLLGSKECYDFIDDNPMVAMMGNQELDARIKVDYSTLTAVSSTTNLAAQPSGGSGAPSASSPKTGDMTETGVAPWLCMMGAALAVVALYGKKKGMQR